MKNIYLYTGQGAYQAKDVENFLAVFDFDYQRIGENQLSKLIVPGIFIVPGGQIKAYLPAWKKVGQQKIKKFVAAGGIYIGICAGAYIAGKKFDNTLGLGFVANELKYRKHQSIVNVVDQNNKKWQLIAENGPGLALVKADKIILSDSNGRPQAIIIKFGKGFVYLFAAHPEGSVYYNKMPQRFSGAKFLFKFLKSF